MNTITYPTPAEIAAIELQARQLRAQALRDIAVALRLRIASLFHFGGTAQHG